jgi:hypothetical protein
MSQRFSFPRNQNVKVVIRSYLTDRNINPLSKPNTEWGLILAISLANQIAKFLPGMNGAGDGPVYTICVKGGQTIGNRRVMLRSF